MACLNPKWLSCVYCNFTMLGPHHPQKSRRAPGGHQVAVGCPEPNCCCWCESKWRNLSNENTAVIYTIIEGGEKAEPQKGTKDKKTKWARLHGRNLWLTDFETTGKWGAVHLPDAKLFPISLPVGASAPLSSVSQGTLYLCLAVSSCYANGTIHFSKALQWEGKHLISK